MNANQLVKEMKDIAEEGLRALELLKSPLPVSRTARTAAESYIKRGGTFPEANAKVFDLMPEVRNTLQLNLINTQQVLDELVRRSENSTQNN